MWKGCINRDWNSVLNVKKIVNYNLKTNQLKGTNLDKSLSVSNRRKVISYVYIYTNLFL
jgi:hypothetical protein